MRLPSLKFLKTFQLAASHLSFKVAAEELCVTASAVSHQIKTLEENLGIALFERGPHSLSLTEAGINYLQHLETIFSKLETVTEQLRVRYGRGVVRFHIPPFFASEMLLPRLPAFLEVRPDTDIHINTTVATLESHPAEADLSVVVGFQPDAGLASYLLFAQTFVPACSPALIDRVRLQNAADLNGQTLLVHEARRDGWEQWAESCGLAPLRPKKLIRFDTMQATAQAAEQGIGIALVSSPLGLDRFMQGSLVKLFDQELATGESYYLTHRVEDGARQEIKAFTRWLLDEFARKQAA
jgi:LysR family glycine cleavage system transcriptional activator